ncbi:hypothetical protein QIU18_06675 [Capnocytophaga canimorsus]|nr:hypothetical protein [Capnocytophaga canimorsus]WGU71463.1 hypothetical protein QIU18_06675 [Capnocytophaga canimorsus]
MYPPTQQIADIALQNAQRSTILIKGIKQGTTTLTLHDTHTNEQLSIEVLVSIPPSSYLLEDNGTTLKSWIGRETEIDMDADPILKNVTKIKSHIFSVQPPPLVTRIKFNEGLTTIEKDAFL